VHLKRHWTLVLALAALSSVEARANDISCATTHQPAERVICDHAILNNEYDDIVAQQQSLLSAGKLSPGQLSQWRQSRNACTDVHCIDTVFAQWNAMAKSAEGSAGAALVPNIASTTASAPVGPSPDAVPAPPSAVAATSDAFVVQRGSAAGVALPQPVASEASAPAVSAASSASASRSTTGMGGGLMAAILIAIGCGAFAIRRRRNVRHSRKP
jgi:uncharacterized protein